MDTQAAGLVPQVFLSGTLDTAPIDCSDAETLDATLGVHAALRTAFAGANNDLDLIAKTAGATTSATATTTMSGANNDITFTAVDQGESYNGWRIKLVNTGPSQALAVSVNNANREITVTLATNAAGAITSTAAQVIAAWSASAANAVATAANAAANDGTGVVTEYDAAMLGGGIASTDINVAFVVAGNNTPLTVGVSGNNVTVNVTTGAGGAATSTATQVASAINASAARDLLYAAVQFGNDGTGVVAAAASAPLVGPQGTTPTLDVTLQTDHGDGVWRAVKAYTQKNSLSADRDTFGPLGDRLRWHIVVAGTGPVFAGSISNVAADVA